MDLGFLHAINLEAFLTLEDQIIPLVLETLQRRYKCSLFVYLFVLWREKTFYDRRKMSDL